MKDATLNLTNANLRLIRLALDKATPDLIPHRRVELENLKKRIDAAAFWTDALSHN